MKVDMEGETYMQKPSKKKKKKEWNPNYVQPELETQELEDLQKHFSLLKYNHVYSGDSSAVLSP